MTEPQPIYLTTDKGSKIMIMSPAVYDAILNVITQPHLRTLFNVCFYTGMRYTEVRRLYQHPEWWMKDRNVIYLNREAQRKVKRITPERYIPVAPQLQGELPYFFKNQQPPVLKVWWENLKRWAEYANLPPEGVTPKMTRATIESWMYAANIPMNEICLRQGHDNLTSLNHYQALTKAFTTTELYEIKKRLSGWVTHSPEFSK